MIGSVNAQSVQAKKKKHITCTGSIITTIKTTVQ